ncbi:hypothetical protein BGZ65_007701 [Modicella reniformis]|uniref:Uncharacterized protein n=1 Tax=Modicella reniformis TaxID=1440133 RepID=A0A9P6MFD1_9FUNG|nr:hypothetical protein BGZ65_007701 [Modicella reniformis]
MSGPLTSSIVQDVLDDGKGLLHLQESLRAVSDVSSSTDSGRDAVVQQVTAFMKENDHQQQLLEQQQQQQQQQQQKHQQEQAQPVSDCPKKDDPDEPKLEPMEED